MCINKNKQYACKCVNVVQCNIIMHVYAKYAYRVAMYSHYCDKINEVCIAKLHVAIATSSWKWKICSYIAS